MSTKPSEGAVKAADDYDALKSDLARVTAERQNWKEWAEEARAMFHKQIDAAAVMKTRAEQAEQRNAELESSVRDLRVAYEQNASQCVRLNRELALKSDTVEWLNGVTIQRQRAEQAERRNAELVAALDDLLGCPTVTDRATCPNGDPSRIDEAPEWQAVLQISCAWTRYKKLKALARAESAIQTKPVEEHISSREVIEGLQEDGS